MKKLKKKIFNKIFSILTFINNRYKHICSTKLKVIFQFLPSNIYLLLLFLILCIITIPKLLNNYTSSYSTVTEVKEPVEIVDYSISQEINTKGIKRIDAIGVSYSTYMRKNSSFYDFLIYKNDDVIYNEKIDASKLKDNKEVLYRIGQKVKEHDKFRFEVKPINVKIGNGITILQDKNDNYLYRVYKKSEFYSISIILSLFMLIIFFIINYLINNEKIKKEEKFYKVVLIYILISTFIMPPKFIPDSNYHFNNAYTVSQNGIIDFIKSNNLKAYEKPSNINCLDYGSVNNNYINVKSSNDIINCFKSEKLEKITYKARINNKIAYVFPALGIKIAMIFTNSPMVIFFMGRLFNTIISFLIILYSIKISPKHKRVILILSTIPVFIQQMCSYSYDSILNSLCILVIAYLLKFFDDDNKIKPLDLVLFLISLIIISIIKLPYILIGIPIIFIKNEKFKKIVGNKFIYLFLIIVSLSLAYFIPKLGGNLGFIDTSGTGDRGMSLSSLFNLKYTLLLIYRTIKYQGLIYLETFVGSLGWLNGAEMSKLFIYSYIIILVLIVLSEKQSLKVKTRIRFSIIFFNIILIGGIFLSMYLSWTKSGSIFIEGVQGRYFYAPILCIMMALIPKNRKIEISNNSVYSFINISCLLYIISLFYLFY